VLFYVLECQSKADATADAAAAASFNPSEQELQWPSLQALAKIQRIMISAVQPHTTHKDHSDSEDSVWGSGRQRSWPLRRSPPLPRRQRCLPGKGSISQCTPRAERRVHAPLLAAAIWPLQPQRLLPLPTLGRLPRRRSAAQALLLQTPLILVGGIVKAMTGR
jgi:hypothetical protein